MCSLIRHIIELLIKISRIRRRLDFALFGLGLSNKNAVKRTENTPSFNTNTLNTNFMKIIVKIMKCFNTEFKI